MPRLNPPTHLEATLWHSVKRIRRMLGLFVLGQTARFCRCFAPQFQTMLAIASSDRPTQPCDPSQVLTCNHPHWARDG
jgi:hypothetical protein